MHVYMKKAFECWDLVNILHLVDDAVLKDVGLMPGNVIHLKQNLQQWWNSADTKHKRVSETPSLVQ
jgi:hypothetical protein